jgi:hypothetical protein
MKSQVRNPEISIFIFFKEISFQTWIESFYILDLHLYSVKFVYVFCFKFLIHK